MGPVEVILSLLKPFTAAAGVTNEWLVSTALNVIAGTAFVKRFIKITDYDVWIAAGVLTMLYSLTLMGAGWMPVVIAFVGVGLLSVVQLKVIGKLGTGAGKVLPNRMNRGPSKNKG